MLRLVNVFKGLAILAAKTRSLLSTGWKGSSTGARRKRVPTVLQMEAVECGAAALAMVLGSFGKNVPLEELRVDCGVSRDGSKASNLLKAARKHGLIAKGFRREPEQLRSMGLPMVIHWNFNHFVVLEGFRKDRVYLNDPGRGPVRVSDVEFGQAFTGVALVFEPGPEFKPGGERRNLLAALVPRLAGSHLGLLFVVLAGFCLLIPGLATPTFSQIFVDDILVRGLSRWLRPLLFVMGVAAFLQIGLTWLRQRYLLRLETKLSVTTSCKYFWHVLRLPIQFFTQRYAGEIANRVGINDKVANLLSGELATTFLNIVVIAFYAALMIQYDIVLTTVSVGIATLNLVALKLVSRKRVDLNQRLLQDRGKLMGVAMGGLQTIETLKATGVESDFFSRWSGYQAKVVNSEQTLATTTHFLSTVPPLLLTINTALILGIGGMRVMDGHLSMGMLMAYQALTLAFIGPINRLVTLGGTLQEVEGDMNRLDDVLRAKPDSMTLVEEAPTDLHEESAELSTGDQAVLLAGYLELRNVTFGYSPLDPPLIQDFNLRIEPGGRVALVGGSGCGKSTIARLVTGLYDVWDGEILFDGKPRSEIPRSIMTNSLAIVDQDIFLFEGDIRDNLTLWDNTIPESDILQAARDAAIHDEISARPNGYSSPVEEEGRNFSGGQRQRLEIARALSRNPTMLILDEATSALDPATEKAIDDNLRRRGVTCLLVAHRLSTIRDCDEIIVLDEGRIVQRGTHDELCCVPGLYSDLIAAE
jgi:NHLM bacteriocin system ABC transporter peptidase/ATP-binding protein